MSTPTAPTRTGYTFAGWYSDAGLTTPYTFTTMPASNITVYAKWTANTYTITFVSNGGSAVTAITQAFGSAVTAPTAPTRTGYTFVGWYSNAGLTTLYTFTTMPVDTTLYAKWTINTYTLTYTAGAHGGVTGTSPQTVNYGSDGTLVTATPNSGYHFVSWSDGVLTAARIDTNVTANISVTASFAANAVTTFTITGSAGPGGSLSITGTVVVEAGSNLTVGVTSDPGYEIASVTVDGVAKPFGSVTFANISADHTVSATFALKKIATKLTINVNPITLKLGHSAHFFGVIAPNMVDRTPIRLMVRKAGQARWTNLAPYVRTFGGYHWSFYYHPNTRGTYYFKVQFAGTATYLGSTSRTVTVVWK